MRERALAPERPESISAMQVAAHPGATRAAARTEWNRKLHGRHPSGVPPVYTEFHEALLSVQREASVGAIRLSRLLGVSRDMVKPGFPICPYIGNLRDASNVLVEADSRMMMTGWRPIPNR